MIISFLLQSAYGFFSFLIGVLPDSTGLPQGLQDAFTLVFGAIQTVSYLIPVDSLFTALGIVVAYEVALWLFFGFLWVWKRIPFIGR